jgi:hypothetical protein
MQGTGSRSILPPTKQPRTPPYRDQGRLLAAECRPTGEILPANAGYILFSLLLFSFSCGRGRLARRIRRGVCGAARSSGGWRSGDMLLHWLVCSAIRRVRRDGGGSSVHADPTFSVTIWFVTGFKLFRRPLINNSYRWQLFRRARSVSILCYSDRCMMGMGFTLLYGCEKNCCSIATCCNRKSCRSELLSLILNEQKSFILPPIIQRSHLL